MKKRVPLLKENKNDSEDESSDCFLNSILSSKTPATKVCDFQVPMLVLIHCFSPPHRLESACEVPAYRSIEYVVRATDQ